MSDTEFWIFYSLIGLAIWCCGNKQLDRALGAGMLVVGIAAKLAGLSHL